MDRIIEDAPLRRKLIANGLLAARRMTVSAFAAQTASLLEDGK